MRAESKSGRGREKGGGIGLSVHQGQFCESVSMSIGILFIYVKPAQGPRRKWPGRF